MSDKLGIKAIESVEEIVSLIINNTQAIYDGAYIVEEIYTKDELIQLVKCFVKKLVRDKQIANH